VRAAEVGLVNRLTEEGGALEGALELAERIAANDPLAAWRPSESPADPIVKRILYSGDIPLTSGDR
jgi:enoyl-CoA hydratase/carnithine racemase